MLGDNGQLFGWSEGTWLWLGQISTLGGNIMMIASLAGALYAWWRRDLIRLWLLSNHFPKTGYAADIEPGQWEAIVFTISREDVPAWVMEQLKPRAVAFLATRQSRESAEKLIHKAENMGIEVIGLHQLSDYTDTTASKEHVSSFIRKLRAAGMHKVAVDITGGTLPMSLGAFMAAEEARSSTLYVSVPYDRELRKPDISRSNILYISRPANP